MCYQDRNNPQKAISSEQDLILKSLKPPRNELWVFSSLLLEKTSGFPQRAKTSRAAACEPQARAALRSKHL